jgi:hypothetical protein
MIFAKNSMALPGAILPTQIPEKTDFIGRGIRNGFYLFGD